jgi:hypothetical protein
MKDAIEAGEDDPTSSFYESILTEIAVHYAGDAIDYEQLDRKPVYEALLQLIQELRDEGRLQDLTGSLTQDDENE